MPSPIRMPQLGESVTEGTVLRWLKQPGDHVALDESLAEIETEKVNVEIPSPFEGTIIELLVPEGETVDVGVPIATIETAAAAGQAGESTATPATASAAPAARAPESVAAATPATVSATPAARDPQPALAPALPAPTVAAAARSQTAAAFSATGPLGPASTAHGMFSTGESATAPASPAPPMATASAPSTPAYDPANPASTNGAGNASRYSPAVLRLAGEHGIDLKALSGTGQGGRITRKDVQSWIDGGARAEAALPGNLSEERQLFAAVSAEAVAPIRSETVEELQESFEPPTTGAPPRVEEPAGAQSSAPARPAAPTPSTAERPVAPSPPATVRPLRDDEELEPLTSTRKAIASHMVRSVQTSPHAWMMIEVDLSRLVAYRERIKATFREREGVDLSYLPFMVKATVAALKQHPRLNSSWSDEGVILKRRINIGIAVDTPLGLVVPVVNDADNLSIAGLARAISDLAARARARHLRMEDVEGGTFTIDNVGPIGSIISQPIINQPQCAIVTMESIVKRPIVIDDAIAIRSIMNCCISFDHRIVDGGDIGPFMKTLKRNLESSGEETPIY